MTSFTITLQYEKQALIKAMKACHGIGNVLIEREEDVAGVARFLLDGAGCSALTLNDNYSATRIEGKNVIFSLAAKTDTPGWRETVEAELQRFQRYIVDCQRQ